LIEKRPPCALGLLESDFPWITDPKVKYIIFSKNYFKKYS
jgi:hypothetical protein